MNPPDDVSLPVPRAQRSRGTLERDLGKPAISAASAMMWRALQLAGVREPIAGYGRLLAGIP